MIVNLNEKIRNKRALKKLLLKDIQSLSFEYFDEVINEDYIQKVESGKFQNMEIWTLYKLSSILESDIFFSDTQNNIEIEIDNQKYTLEYSSLLPIDPKYSQNHRGIEYKEQFLYLIGNHIKSSRKKLNLTQLEFSGYCSISISTLQRIELGLTSSKLNTLIKALFTIYKLNKQRNQ